VADVAIMADQNEQILLGQWRLQAQSTGVKAGEIPRHNNALAPSVTRWVGQNWQAVDLAVSLDACHFGDCSLLLIGRGIGKAEPGRDFGTA